MDGTMSAQSSTPSLPAERQLVSRRSAPITKKYGCKHRRVSTQATRYRKTSRTKRAQPQASPRDSLFTSEMQDAAKEDPTSEKDLVPKKKNKKTVGFANVPDQTIPTQKMSDRNFSVVSALHFDDESFSFPKPPKVAPSTSDVASPSSPGDSAPPELACLWDEISKTSQVATRKTKAMLKERHLRRSISEPFLRVNLPKANVHDAGEKRAGYGLFPSQSETEKILVDAILARAPTSRPVSPMPAAPLKRSASAKTRPLAWLRTVTSPLPLAAPKVEPIAIKPALIVAKPLEVALSEELLKPVEEAKPVEEVEPVTEDEPVEEAVSIEEAKPEAKVITSCPSVSSLRSVIVAEMEKQQAIKKETPAVKATSPRSAPVTTAAPVHTDPVQAASVRSSQVQPSSRSASVQSVRSQSVARSASIQSARGQPAPRPGSVQFAPVRAAPTQAACVPAVSTRPASIQTAPVQSTTKIAPRPASVQFAVTQAALRPASVQSAPSRFTPRPASISSHVAAPVTAPVLTPATVEIPAEAAPKVMTSFQRRQLQRRTIEAPMAPALARPSVGE